MAALALHWAAVCGRRPTSSARCDSGDRRTDGRSGGRRRGRCSRWWWALCVFVVKLQLKTPGELFVGKADLGGLVEMLHLAGRKEVGIEDACVAERVVWLERRLVCDCVAAYGTFIQHLDVGDAYAMSACETRWDVQRGIEALEANGTLKRRRPVFVHVVTLPWVR